MEIYKNNGNFTNEYNQRAGDCVSFMWNEKKYGGCQDYENWQKNEHECIVCKGLFCTEFKKGR